MSKQDFIDFHNQVLNIPRDRFSNFNLSKVRSLLEYLKLVEEQIPQDGVYLTELYVLIHKELQINSIVTPNPDFIDLFDLNLKSEKSIRNHYYKYSGRLFRHWMELATLFAFLQNMGIKRVISNDVGRLVNLNDKELKKELENIVLNLNVGSNPFFLRLDSASFYKGFDFRPATAIVQYLKEIKRPATMFELSIFFGRPNVKLKSESVVISDAIKHGKTFPYKTTDQIDFFFRSKNWIDKSGRIFRYSPSQQPYFKFRVIFIIMEHLGLIKTKNDIVVLA